MLTCSVLCIYVLLLNVLYGARYWCDPVHYLTHFSCVKKVGERYSNMLATPAGLDVEG